MNHRPITFLATACFLTALAGCGEPGNEPVAQSSTPQPTEPTTPAWILTTAPSNAVSVTDAKATAQEGDQIAVRGRIGGRHDPISEESPAFTVVDLSLPHCGQMEDDQCRSPWDYCCETPETIMANSATAQIVDQVEVNPLAAGLKPLDEVIIVGTVGPRLDSNVLTIRATGVYPVGG